MTNQTGYISGGVFVPSNTGKYTRDNTTGKVTDTTTGNTSGASYTREYRDNNNNPLVNDVIYDSSNNPKSYISNGRQITIGSPSDTPEAQAKANITINKPQPTQTPQKTTNNQATYSTLDLQKKTSQKATEYEKLAYEALQQQQTLNKLETYNKQSQEPYTSGNPNKDEYIRQNTGQPKVIITKTTPTTEENLILNKPNPTLEPKQNGTGNQNQDRQNNTNNNNNSTTTTQISKQPNNGQRSNTSFLDNSTDYIVANFQKVRQVAKDYYEKNIKPIPNYFNNIKQTSEYKENGTSNYFKTIGKKTFDIGKDIVVGTSQLIEGKPAMEYAQGNYDKIITPEEKTALKFGGSVGIFSAGLSIAPITTSIVGGTLIGKQTIEYVGNPTTEKGGELAFVLGTAGLIKAGSKIKDIYSETDIVLSEGKVSGGVTTFEGKGILKGKPYQENTFVFEDTSTSVIKYEGKQYIIEKNPEITNVKIIEAGKVTKKYSQPTIKENNLNPEIVKQTSTAEEIFKRQAEDEPYSISKFKETLKTKQQAQQTTNTLFQRKQAELEIQTKSTAGTTTTILDQQIITKTKQPTIDFNTKQITNKPIGYQSFDIIKTDVVYNEKVPTINEEYTITKTPEGYTQETITTKPQPIIQTGQEYVTGKTNLRITEKPRPLFEGKKAQITLQEPTTKTPEVYKQEKVITKSQPIIQTGKGNSQITLQQTKTTNKIGIKTKPLTTPTTKSYPDNLDILKTGSQKYTVTTINNQNTKPLIENKPIIENKPTTKLININKTITNQIPITQTTNKQNQINIQENKQTTKQEVNQKQNTKSKQNIFQQQENKQEQKQEQKQQTQQIQKQEQKQQTRTKQITIPIEIQKQKIQITTPLISQSSKKKPEEGFNVLTRERGVFKQANTRPLSKVDAENFGRYKTATTSQASFKLQKANTKATDTFKLQTPSKSNYYESKKEAGVIIEKNTYRINTTGERQQITEKGIQSRRRKNNIFGNQNTKTKKIFG